ncbi:hypothetical protein NL676_000869 [Syzygium grande]|nr:hypothetical protein NL676_000869 [Syzygium grande]
MMGSRYYRDASFNDGRGGMNSTSTAAMDAGQAQANELPTWGVHGGRLLDGCSFHGYASKPQEAICKIATFIVVVAGVVGSSLARLNVDVLVFSSSLFLHRMDS